MGADMENIAWYMREILPNMSSYPSLYIELYEVGFGQYEAISGCRYETYQIGYYTIHHAIWPLQLISYCRVQAWKTPPCRAQDRSPLAMGTKLSAVPLCRWPAAVPLVPYTQAKHVPVHVLFYI